MVFLPSIRCSARICLSASLHSDAGTTASPALIAGVLVSLATFRHQPVVEQEFDEAAAIASGQEPTATV